MGLEKRLPYVWDYDIDAVQFRELLSGQTKIGRLDRDWAARRLLEYAPYAEIVKLLGFRRLVAGWPHWRNSIRSVSRKRGMDFLVEWLRRERPELLQG